MFADIGLTGKLVAGGILGLGLFWFVVKMIREGQKAQLDKISAENFIKQEEQNKVIVENVKKAADDARSKVDAAPNTDW